MLWSSFIHSVFSWWCLCSFGPNVSVSLILCCDCNMHLDHHTIQMRRVGASDEIFLPFPTKAFSKPRNPLCCLTKICPSLKRECVWIVTARNNRTVHLPFSCVSMSYESPAFPPVGCPFRISATLWWVDPTHPPGGKAANGLASPSDSCFLCTYLQSTVLEGELFVLSLRWAVL